MDKSFERAYSLTLNRLKQGRNEEIFSLDKAFVSHFALSFVQDCVAEARVEIFKSNAQLDVVFHISGKVLVACDRCLEDMWLPIQNETRIIYSFDKHFKDSDDLEVIYVEEKEVNLTLVQELYDFLCTAIPFRKVHEDVKENCPDFVSKYIINQNEIEDELEADFEEDEEDEIDED